VLFRSDSRNTYDPSGRSGSSTSNGASPSKNGVSPSPVKEKIKVNSPQTNLPSPVLANSLPSKGEPNSTGRLYNPDGSLKQEREYGPDGRAQKDTDYNHPGDNHEFPHEHDWDWTKSPPRLPGKSPGPTSIQENNIGKATAWATAGVVIYWIVSEGSRIVFPVRNLIPIL
jgi:hypothetical protein